MKECTLVTWRDDYVVGKPGEIDEGSTISYLKKMTGTHVTGANLILFLGLAIHLDSVKRGKINASAPVDGWGKVRCQANALRKDYKQLSSQNGLQLSHPVQGDEGSGGEGIHTILFRKTRGQIRGRDLRDHNKMRK